MTWSKRMLVAVAALVGFAQLSGDAAQPRSAYALESEDGGFVCGLCSEGIKFVLVDRFTPNEHPEPLGWYHKFPGGTDHCTLTGGGNNRSMSNEEGDEGGAPPEDAFDQDNWYSKCAGCGLTTICHTGEEAGRCHVACNPQSLASVGAALEKALQDKDVAALSSILKTQHKDLTVTYIAAGGRIEIMADCNQASPAKLYEVDKSLKAELEHQALR